MKIANDFNIGDLFVSGMSVAYVTKFKLDLCFVWSYDRIAETWNSMAFPTSTIKQWCSHGYWKYYPVNQ